MSMKELENKIRELRELKAFAAELAGEIEAAEDAIKAHMGDAEEIRAGEYKVTWKRVTGRRIDTKALAAELPDVAERYSIKTESRRFFVA